VKSLGLLFAFMFVFALSPIYCEVLTMNKYLDMVTKNNSELKSVQLSIDAENEKLAGIEKIYSYFLNTEINYINDWTKRSRYEFHKLKRQKKTNYDYDISMNKQFKTGTKVSLGVDCSSSKTRVNQRVNDVFSFVKLQQSLWKDMNGKLTKTAVAKSRADTKSALHLLEHKKHNILFDAKLAYWNLSYSRTVVSFRKLSLDRTKKNLEWNKKRYSMDLVEKSDLLQSQAAVKLRELNLELAHQEEDRLSRILNMFLGIRDSRVKFDIENFENKENSFNVIINNDYYIPNKKCTRSDVLAALENVQVASYDQIFSKRNLGPDLVLSGQFALKNSDKSFDTVTKYTINMDRPSSYSMGLKYILPLDFKLRKTVNKGYEEARYSAQKYAEYMMIMENNDWCQLLHDWNNAKMRLGLVIEIENIQRSRYKEDENLLRTGRSTTYLVLKSEQDLDDAVLNVLQVVLELIKIYEKIETFYNYRADIA
jgi:outer membrane protein TolC